MNCVLKQWFIWGERMSSCKVQKDKNSFDKEETGNQWALTKLWTYELQLERSHDFYCLLEVPEASFDSKSAVAQTFDWIQCDAFNQETDAFNVKKSIFWSLIDLRQLIVEIWP